MSYYVGDRSPSGKKHGKGQFKWGPKGHANRLCSYFGDFSNDFMQGYGVFHYPDGTVFEGKFEKDKKNGYGKFKYMNGNVYEGEIYYDVLMGGTFHLAETKTTYNIQMDFKNEPQNWLNGERIYDAVLVERSPSKGARSCIIYGQGPWRFGSFLAFEKISRLPKPYTGNRIEADDASSELTLTHSFGDISSVSGMSVSTVDSIEVANATLTLPPIDMVICSWQTEIDRQSKERVEIDRLAKAEADQLAREKANNQRLKNVEAYRKEAIPVIKNLFARAEVGLIATEKTEQAERERLTKIEAEREVVAKEKAEIDRLLKLEEERLAELDRNATAEKAEVHALAKIESDQKFEAHRIADEKIELERLVKIETDRKTKLVKAEIDRSTRDQFEKERPVREQAERVKKAREQAEREKIAREQAKKAREAEKQVEREGLAQMEADRNKAFQDRRSKEKDDRNGRASSKAEIDKQAREKARKEALRENTERDRQDQEQAEKQRASCCRKLDVLLKALSKDVMQTLDIDYLEDNNASVESKYVAKEYVSRFKEGDKVEGNYRGVGKWREGKINRNHGNGTYDISYKEGDLEVHVQEYFLRQLDDAVDNYLDRKKGKRAVAKNVKGKKNKNNDAIAAAAGDDSSEGDELNKAKQSSKIDIVGGIRKNDIRIDMNRANDDGRSTAQIGGNKNDYKSSNDSKSGYGMDKSLRDEGNKQTENCGVAADNRLGGSNILDAFLEPFPIAIAIGTSAYYYPGKYDDTSDADSTKKGLPKRDGRDMRLNEIAKMLEEDKVAIKIEKKYRKKEKKEKLICQTANESFADKKH